ncbi:hypothetical protein MHK_006868 [Candidatus Magnetomorum sp. HK-1]|nr:hypothetical protein MHK_006868 [Candidatus Magnetomorum sp. HK-1]
MKKSFYLCINNKDCPDLEIRKVYYSINDPVASKYGQIRVIDESEEDYLYPQDNFVALDLPQVAERVFDLAA